MAQTISSRDNETVKHLAKLAADRALRRSEQRFLAEGARLCEELAKTLTPQCVLYTQQALARYPRIGQLAGEQFVLAPHVAEKLAGTQNTQGVFAVFALPRPDPAQLVRAGGRWLYLENVQDPANVGALLRSAAAFGFDGVLLSPGCADVFGAKALRASMGAAGRIPVCEEVPVETAAQLGRAAGLAVLAAALQNAVPLESAPSPQHGVLLLIGNEGSGLTPQAVAAADTAVRIPMTERVESLNAAVAGSVLLWHFRGV